MKREDKNPEKSVRRHFRGKEGTKKSLGNGGWWFSRQVVTDPCNPMDCRPARLLCPQDFSGKNTGVGCHFLLQGGNVTFQCTASRHRLSKKTSLTSSKEPMSRKTKQAKQGQRDCSTQDEELNNQVRHVNPDQIPEWQGRLGIHEEGQYMRSSHCDDVAQCPDSQIYNDVFSIKVLQLLLSSKG